MQGGCARLSLAGHNISSPHSATTPCSFTCAITLPSHSASFPLLPGHVWCTAGRFGLYGWLRMLLVSYFSNLVGALLLVGLMKGAGGEQLGRDGAKS